MDRLPAIKCLSLILFLNCVLPATTPAAQIEKRIVKPLNTALSKGLTLVIDDLMVTTTPMPLTLNKLGKSICLTQPAFSAAAFPIRRRSLDSGPDQRDLFDSANRGHATAG
jgi:hypothetical protein